MGRKTNHSTPEKTTVTSAANSNRKAFHLEFKNGAQKLAWNAFEQHDVLFLLGPAGCGKSYLACAFAISEILSKKKKRIILTRPIVEAGESLGFLPGTADEKIDPYMMPLYDCITKLVGSGGPEKEKIDRSVELAPLAYMRGRSQPLDALILTPTGYVKMGDLQIGDKVISSDGTATEVLKLYPQGELDVFRIKFSDGTYAECSEDHLWSTMTLNEKRHDKGFSVKSTAEIIKTVKNKHNQKIHRVPTTEPVQFKNIPVNVDPYIMGVILGDGNSHKKSSISITNELQSVISEVIKRLPEGLSLKAFKDNGIQYKLTGKRNKTNPIRSYFAEIGLLGKKSYQKWIPEEYLFGNLETRINVLRGLMDTDGSIFKHRSGNCRVQYYSTSKTLAENVRFLVHSLGGTASIRKRDFEEDDCHVYNDKLIKHCRPLYVVDIVTKINPFLCEEKASLFKPMKPQRLICSVEKIGKKECQCIRVAAKDHLYLTEHCIVTHNTFDDAICIFDEAQNASYMQLKLFLTRFGENSKIIINGDPRQSDLHGDVALVKVVDRLKEEPGIGLVEFGMDSIVRHPLVGRILDRLGE